MNTEHGYGKALALLGVLAGLGIGGCAGQEPSSVKAPPSKGAAQMWAENCNRCHNIRPAGEFSDAQWDVIMHHMRVRANLTGEEYRQILTFLKASN